MLKTSDANARRRALASLDTISAEEDAAINAGIAADPDTVELDDAWFKGAKRGRPPAAKRKQAVNLRLDPDVLAHFKAEGPGWQSRINEALRKVAGL
ncbi:MAG: hypothetical protein GC191_08005 [Azospirillum sp.]|nr:hypothetical protein [Azospirillum sp.]